MRRPVVAGNWKMNGTVAEATAIVRGLLAALDGAPTAEVWVCPPTVWLTTVGSLLGDGPVRLGAQDVFWAEKGAFTGQTSPAMLKEAGVGACIVGHSETRGRFGKLEVLDTSLGFFAETDETVGLKVRSLLAVGLTPVVCVGETIVEREAGQTDSVIEGQIRGALGGLSPESVGSLIVAYEPVWAIGTGRTCDAAEAERVCGAIRGVLGSLAGTQQAESTRILYGGSVKADNASELFAQLNIDGGLVGGASLDPVGFAQIVLSAQ